MAESTDIDGMGFFREAALPGEAALSAEAVLSGEAVGHGEPVRDGALRPVANLCTAGSCPTVYLDAANGSVVVQGFDVSPSAEGVEVPAGESLVRVPVALLREAMRNLS